MSQVHEIPFHGDNLIGVKTDAGIMVPLKPITDGIGLDWENERRRIRAHPTLNKGTAIIEVPFGAGGPQPMLCILLRRLNFWLATVHPNRTTNADRLDFYQEEAADVLFAYFMPQFSQAMGIKLPTLQGRLLQDDLLDRAPAEASDDRREDRSSADFSLVLDCLTRIERLVAIDAEPSIVAAVRELLREMEVRLAEPIKRTDCRTAEIQVDFWRHYKIDPDNPPREPDPPKTPKYDNPHGTASGLRKLVEPKRRPRPVVFEE